jgi:hypothetical protein
MVVTQYETQHSARVTNPAVHQKIHQQTPEQSEYQTDKNSVSSTNSRIIRTSDGDNFGLSTTLMLDNKMLYRCSFRKA